jgi:hypothetical protein
VQETGANKNVLSIKHLRTPLGWLSSGIPRTINHALQEATI